MELNEEQQEAVNSTGNVVVTACPGSGKTRVLTARLIRGVDELKSSRECVVALTFTNRAADEVRYRIEQHRGPRNRFWTGTIHAFALEWVLRPYAPYEKYLQYGFTLADEYYCENLLREIRNKLGLKRYVGINTVHGRDGSIYNNCEKTKNALKLYKQELRNNKVIDYNEVLYYAYRLLVSKPEIASNLGSLFQLICVDEVQDIQDLQFGILSEIYRSSLVNPEMFFVGDSDQCIYESLGAVAKSPDEIAIEFEMVDLQHLELIGNYRSTQRIIDFCGLMRYREVPIDSRIENPNDPGLILFENQSVDKGDLPERITNLISTALESGIPEHEICVVAPHWAHVKELASLLIQELPEVSFDAPGLSPLYGVRDNLWFNLARIFLTEPEPARVRARVRWANEFLTDLEFVLCSEVPKTINSARKILRLTNQLESFESEGIPYLLDLFTQFLEKISIEISTYKVLNELFVLFFEKAENRIAEYDGELPTSAESFKSNFSYRTGVVVNTCHGVKGEEYDTVIAFGLLRGYVPNWSVIINGTVDEADQHESKLLYVVASRAKRQLHLFAESGRRTVPGNPYQTASLLEKIEFEYC